MEARKTGGASLIRIGVFTKTVEVPSFNHLHFLHFCTASNSTPFPIVLTRTVHPDSARYLSHFRPIPNVLPPDTEREERGKKPRISSNSYSCARQTTMTDSVCNKARAGWPTLLFQVVFSCCSGSFQIPRPRRGAALQRDGGRLPPHFAKCGGGRFRVRAVYA